MDHGGGERDRYVFCQGTFEGLQWLMEITACTFGASIICVDLVIRLLPGHRNFKIEDSNAFLSTGLSLSFGVMVGHTSRQILRILINDKV